MGGTNLRVEAETDDIKERIHKEDKYGEYSTVLILKNLFLFKK